MKNMRALPLLCLFLVLISMSSKAAALPSPPLQVQQAGQFVDTINKEYEAEVLIANVVPQVSQITYEVAINPNISPAPSQLQIFSQRLTALGFTQQGMEFLYLQPISPTVVLPTSITKSNPPIVKFNTNFTSKLFNQSLLTTPGGIKSSDNLAVSGLFLALLAWLLLISKIKQKNPKKSKKYKLKLSRKN